MEDRIGEGIIARDDWLDAEELPFTQEEVLKAASLWLDPAEARELTEALVRDTREYWSHRMTWETPFRPQPGRIGMATTQIPWLWPSLSVLSASCATRVRQWMRVYWQNRLSTEIEQRKRQASGKSESQTASEEETGNRRPSSIAEVQNYLGRVRTLSSAEIEIIAREAEADVSAEQSSWTQLAAGAEARFHR
ncbi:MAG TPA: hypothetical protein VIM15_13770 [Gemmatimonadaceae bacterium]